MKNVSVPSRGFSQMYPVRCDTDAATALRAFCGGKRFPLPPAFRTEYKIFKTPVIPTIVAKQEINVILFDRDPAFSHLIGLIAVIR